MLVLAKQQIRIRRGMLLRRRCCCSGGGGGYACATCTIPAKNLTLTWDDASTMTCTPETGTATLVYNGAGAWQSPCLCGSYAAPGTCVLLFVLACNSNTVTVSLCTAVAPCTCGATGAAFGGCCAGTLSGGSGPAGSLTVSSMTCGASFMLVGSANPDCTVTPFFDFTVSA